MVRSSSSLSSSTICGPQCTARKAANGCKDAHLQVHCTVLKKLAVAKVVPQAALNLLVA